MSERLRTLHEPRIGTNTDGETVCAACGRNTNDPRFGDSHGPTDLRARLDAAITAAREALTDAIQDYVSAWTNRYTTHARGTQVFNAMNAALDGYGDLRELRARWDELSKVAAKFHNEAKVRHIVLDEAVAEIEADVRRLLPVDGPTEAHSARKQDQPSG